MSDMNITKMVCVYAKKYWVHVCISYSPLLTLRQLPNPRPTALMNQGVLMENRKTFRRR